MTGTMGVLVVALALSACTDEDDGPEPIADAGPDSGGDPEPDAAAEPDGGSADCTGSDGLPCLTLESGEPANFGCAYSEPSGGDPMPLELRASSHVTFGPPPEGTAIWIFPDAVIADVCEDPCIEVTTDAEGLAYVDLSAGEFAFRFPPTGDARGDLYDSCGYRSRYPDEDSRYLGFLTNGQLADGAEDLGRSPTGAALITGPVLDCDHEMVAGASVRVYVDGVEVVTGDGPTDPFIAYVVGLEISLDASTTGAFGRYFAGLPMSGPATVRVESYGARAAGADRVRVGCSEFRAFPDRYVQARVDPLRMQYPPGHGCAED